jgi:hypothetical protein
LAKDYWTTGKIYEGHLSSATSKHKCKMLNVGNTAVALITIRDQPELAEKFWTGVASMEKLEIGDPRMTLAKAIDDGNIGCCIVKDGLTPPHAVAAALAWNAFFSGKTLKAIRSGSSNFFILGTRFSRPSRA